MEVKNNDNNQAVVVIIIKFLTGRSQFLPLCLGEVRVIFFYIFFNNVISQALLQIFYFIKLNQTF